MSKNILLILFSVLFFLHFFYFQWRGFKRTGTKEYENSSLFRQKNIAFDIGLSEPWRTKYKWGGIVQIILIALIIFLSNF